MDKIIDWLLKGDPSIRYQTMRDILNAPCEELLKERDKISRQGWGDQLLNRQDPLGTWGKGIYTPKWISTTYTLLLLRRLAISPKNPQARQGAQILLDKGFYEDNGINYFKSLNHSETCVTGIVLSILCYFNIEDARINKLVNHLFEQQMPDGGWNCQSYNKATHSSFHTTVLVLEGLREYEKYTSQLNGDCKSSSLKAIEFLLQHKLYKSDKTGKIVDYKMTYFSFPPRWRYDVMRVLDFIQEAGAEKDKRMNDAIHLLLKKRTKEGLWKLQGKHPGKTFFEMEKVGQPSRWNTLRALRILKWWENH